MSEAVSERTEQKRNVTRWNRRMGWALLFFFPFSYLAAWLETLAPDGVLGSWLSLLNISAQVISTVLLLAHAAYSFYVFGFPSMRLTLRTVNGYAAYLVLFVYLLSQTAVDLEPQKTILDIASFTAIGIHVVLALILAKQRPRRTDPTLREDFRTLMSPDAEVLDSIVGTLTAGQAPASDTALLAQRLDVTLGSVQVLFGVDLEVKPGEVVALMGNNGAGKTTTLRSLSGLQRLTSGHVMLEGFDVTALSAAGRAELGVSLVVGGSAVFGPMTVRENLEMFAYRLQISPRERAERVGTVIETFPWVKDRADQLASTLSGGERQMLAVSQALLIEPKVLMIDEFSLGLAPKIVGQLMDLVRQISAQGTAVLLVEQSASVALDMAERIYVMERGRIVLHETSATLRANPDRLAEVYLLGSETEAAAR